MLLILNMLRDFGFLPVLLALVCLFSSSEGAIATEFEHGLRRLPYKRYASQKMIEANLSAEGAKLKVIHNDPRLQKRAEKLVRFVDRVYRKLFPTLMANKAVADFVIVNSNDLSDTVTYTDGDLTSKDYRGYLILPKVILGSERPERDPKVIGIVAHEMAHLYLRHTNVDRLILDAWEADSGEKLDPRKMMNFGIFLSDAVVIGQGFDEVWNGMPAGPSLLRDALAKLIDQLKREFPSAQCVKDADAMGGDLLNPILSKSYSYYEWRNIFHSDLEARISGAFIDSFQQHLITCSKNVGFKSTVLRDLRFPNAYMKIDSARYIAFQLSRQFEWQDQNEFEVLFELGRRLQQGMRQNVANSQLNTIRWRSLEDEADDFAAVVLDALKLPIEGYGDGLLGILDRLQPDSAVKCRFAIASDTPIPYGGLDDPHHSLCYRVKDLERRFSAGISRKLIQF